MASHLPLPLRQLAANPALVLLCGVLVAALALLVCLLATCPRGWRVSWLTLAQAFQIAALLAAIFGAGWGSSYDAANIQGSIHSYLEGASGLLFGVALVASGMLFTIFAMRVLMRLGRLAARLRGARNPEV